MSTSKHSKDEQVSKDTQYARIWIDSEGLHLVSVEQAELLAAFMKATPEDYVKRETE